MRLWPRISGSVLRPAPGRKAEPNAAILDSRTLRSEPESGTRAGYDGAKRKKGSKLHLAVDTLGHLLALHVTPASAKDRGEVERLAKAVQASTGQSVDLAYVDQSYSGKRAASATMAQGIDLELIKLPQAKRGFVLLPRRWVVERSFAWATRFRRLTKGYEKYASTLADLHIVAFACITYSRSITASSVRRMPSLEPRRYHCPIHEDSLELAAKPYRADATPPSQAQ